MGQSVSKAIKHIKEAIVATTRRILPPIVQYIVEHPIRAAFHVVNAVALIAPAAIFSPVLGLVGFTGVGIAGGSIAAGVQSAMGTVGAGSVFATLQSAAMGGYGTTVVANGVRAGVMMAEHENFRSSRS
ncbi:hypothetical protein B0J11DRAFT_583583 [Dendryphion nanum]|uniref:Uncharacterized protein n=1 Tax=Dendryphion nanum TaxID=256645 RepID=A0A9P9DDN5_9PLEO|nr:hypothetical protein B0J11DRAFT_583583 [Dendryphion nanum]